MGLTIQYNKGGSKRYHVTGTVNGIVFNTTLGFSTYGEEKALEHATELHNIILRAKKIEAKIKKELAKIKKAKQIFDHKKRMFSIRQKNKNASERKRLNKELNDNQKEA